MTWSDWKTILVVDDDPHVLLALSKRLREAGLDVLTAASGSEALELIQNTTVDAMTLDVAMLGDMNGMDVASALALARIPIKVRRRSLRRGGPRTSSRNHTTPTCSSECSRASSGRAGRSNGFLRRSAGNRSSNRGQLPAPACRRDEYCSSPTMIERLTGGRSLSAARLDVAACWRAITARPPNLNVQADGQRALPDVP